MKYLIVHKETGETVAEPKNWQEAQVLLMIDPENTEIVTVGPDGSDDRKEEQGE